MSEKTQWDTVRSALVQSIEDDATRVENPAWPGTPDVNYCMNGIEGWIELKQTERWPVRPDTPLAVDHFTPQQRVWLRRRSAAGGRVHMLLKVGRDWLLLEGTVAARVVGKRPQRELVALSQKVWRGGLIAQELREALARSMPHSRV